MKKNRNTITDVLLLILITVITYWPVSFCLFSLKNDSLVQYLPFRYHLSEAVQHGYFPFWSPYLYTGFPIHADLQGMVWNPIVLIISLFTRYNMSVLQAEVTIYLILAAIGMYSLLKSFSCSRVICLIGGISYMSCGFINGSASVIPWISSAAFIPFVFKYLYDFLQQPNLKTSLLVSISLSFLFLCCYPTFFIYTGYILFTVFLFAAIFHLKDKPTPVNGKAIGLLAISLIIFLLICSPAIISYWEFLPYYSRGSGISMERAGQNPFTPFSSISYLLPNAVNKEHSWLNTDASMKNAYTGLFVFLLFCLSLRKKYTRWEKLFLGFTIFSFLLSLGDATPLHKLCYAALPMFNTFRHPGNIRLFTSIGIILLAALYAQKLSELSIHELKKKILPVLYSATTFFLLITVIYFFNPEVRENIGQLINTNKQPKALLDTVSFSALVLVESLVQVFFLALVIWLLKRDKVSKKAMAGLIVFNSVLFCWIALPFTFISQVKTKTINQYVESFPDGYPLPEINDPVEANTYNTSASVSPYGYANFYNKTITIQDHLITPTINKDYEDFCSNKVLRKLMDKYPFAYFCDTILNRYPDSILAKSLHTIKIGILTDTKFKPGILQHTTARSVSVINFTPNSFTFEVNSSSNEIFAFFQQYNHNWKVTINGNPAELLKMNIAFMGTVIPAGKNKVVFCYKPFNIIHAMYVSLSAILLILIYFIFTLIKSKQKR